MHDSTTHKQLWQAVLLRTYQDIKNSTDGYEGHKAFIEAARWVGRYPSRQFKEVCMLAGLEPDFVHPRFVKIIQEAKAKDAACNTTKKEPLALAAE